jgi:hypothetical protein
MTLETGHILQPTNTPWDMDQYQQAAEHLASELGGILTGEHTIIYPALDDPTIPEDMRTGVPLLRWTWVKQVADG